MKNAEESIIKNTIELTLIPGVGTVTQNRIWKMLPDLGKFFTMGAKSVESLGLSSDVYPIINSRAYREIAAEIYDWSIREGCHFLIKGDRAYPALLEEIFDPPLIMYARGQMDILEKPCIAIVGTRKPTIYGLQMAEGIASDLGSRGMTVVSGLARGIDAAAHRGCLKSGGVTIAVLGCGIDIIYPREHRQLTQKIIDNGLLLSEFPPGTSPAPQNFPIRNRIISGLALGTLVIEASEYSGSLITARMAMEQNREVFALPGNLTSPQSFGPNFLIKQGAKLVQSWKDIVEELPSNLRQEILIRENTASSADTGLQLLSDEEIGLLKLLKTDEATQFDKILQGSNLNISDLSSRLLNLEMHGWIRQLPGNLYIRVSK